MENWITERLKIEKLKNWKIEILKNWIIENFEKLENWNIEKSKNRKIEKFENWKTGNNEILNCKTDIVDFCKSKNGKFFYQLTFYGMLGIQI